MSVATLPSGSIPPFPVRRFTVDEYHHMIRTGLLTEDDPVELLEGWIVPKMPRNRPHDGTISIAHESLRNRVPRSWCIHVQCAITTPDSEPEPDIAVASGPSARYLAHHPGPDEIALLVEVADTSLNRDRDEKGRIYARARIPVYWIINLQQLLVEVDTDPSGPTAVPEYRQSQSYSGNDEVPLLLPGGITIQCPVSELIPAVSNNEVSGQ